MKKGSVGQLANAFGVNCQLRSVGESDVRLLAWFPTPIRQAGSLPAESAKLADIQFREWLRLVTRATLRRSGFGVIWSA
jgi:hypothetical protein